MNRLRPTITLERETTKLRLQATIRLLAQSIEMGREIGARMLTQADWDEAAMVAMHESLEALDDLSEVEALSGGPVEMTPRSSLTPRDWRRDVS